MPSYTPDKHTIWILPFISPSESNPQCPAVVRPTNSSSPSLMDSCLHHLNWLSKIGRHNEGIYWQDFLDKRMQQRQYGCRMNQNHQHHLHRQENNKKTHTGLLKPSSSCCRPS